MITGADLIPTYIVAITYSKKAKLRRYSIRLLKMHRVINHFIRALHDTPVVAIVYGNGAWKTTKAASMAFLKGFVDDRKVTVYTLGMEAKILEPQREIPVVLDADVIVAGGGPGGIPAAVAAARHGARVVLIERYGFLGGLATAGLVSPVLGHTASKSSTPIVEGILKELTESMHRIGGAPSWPETLDRHSIPFDAEAFKYAADCMVADAGVTVMLHTYVAGTIVENGNVKAIITESKSGRQAITGKICIDATGDGDVAAQSGVPFTFGRHFDGKVESMGSFIHIGGIEDATEDQKSAAVEKLQSAMMKGKFKFYGPGFANRNTVYTDHFSPNMTRWPGDSTNVKDMTGAEIGIRREAWDFIEFLRLQPGFENSYLRATSPQVGPRESRQISGGYALTGDDVSQGKKYSDGIARGSWWIDIHCPRGLTFPVHLCVAECPEGEKCSFWASEHQDSMRSRNDLYPPDGDWYDIPYRCLCPQRIDNLLVSGRCISATHQGMAGARVMGTCMAIGQAAGTAAAIAYMDSTALRDIEVGLLRRSLEADGALV